MRARENERERPKKSERARTEESESDRDRDQKQERPHRRVRARAVRGWMDNDMLVHLESLLMKRPGGELVTVTSGGEIKGQPRARSGESPPETWRGTAAAEHPLFHEGSEARSNSKYI